MRLWCTILPVALRLRPAFSRNATFLWFLVSLTGFLIRTDTHGVTSIVRALGLKPESYDLLRHFFHSSAVDSEKLAQLWLKAVLELFPLYKISGAPVVLLDGIKIPKEGKKMPGVKNTFQQSESNSKPNFIMGHSFQAFGVLCEANGYFFCVPVMARIHEGVKTANFDQRTLLDKANEMLTSKFERPFPLLADSYYANEKIILHMEKHGSSVVSRVAVNAVGYEAPVTPEIKKRGRPAKYGRKIKLSELFSSSLSFVDAPSPVYGEDNITISYLCIDLLWKPVKRKMRFVLVDHPKRGRIILISSNLEMSPLEMIRLYSLRFKIEVTFKQAVHSVGAFSYHFWMAGMDKLKRKSGTQYLHHKSEEYREAVFQKIGACHLYVSTGLMSQGLLQYLAMTKTSEVWRNYGSWIKTIRPDILPSERIVMDALRETFPEFLQGTREHSALAKFIYPQLDVFRGQKFQDAA